MNEPMRVRDVIEQLQRFDQDARCQVEFKSELPAPADEEWLNDRDSLLLLREQNEHGIRYIVFSN